MIYTLVKSLFKRSMPRVPSFTTKSIIKSIVQSIISFVFIIGLIYFLTFILTQIINTFVRLRLHNVYLSFIFFIILLVLIIVAVYLIVRNLYFSKDNELYLKLPIKKRDLFISKLIYIYITLTFLTFFFLLLTAGLYGFIWQAVNNLFFLKLLSLTFLLPLIAMPIGIILSIPIAYITRHLTKDWKRLLIMIFILVTFIFVIYMGFISVITNFINLTSSNQTNYISPDIINEINKITKMLPLGHDLYLYVTNQTNLLSFSLLLTFTTLFNIVSYLLLKKYFYQMLMLNHNLLTSPNKVKSTVKVRTPLKAVFIKEVKLLFKNPSYAFQAIIFNALMPLFVFLTINLTKRVGTQAVGSEIVPGIALLTILIMLMISNSYQTSLISREKESFYLSKITPISYAKQIITRLSVGVIISFIFLLITILLLVSLSLLSLLSALFIFLISLLFLIGFNAVAVVQDLKDPHTSSYNNENKESMKVFSIFFWGIIITIILSFAIILLSYLPNDFMLTNIRQFYNLSERYSFYAFFKYIRVDSLLITFIVLTILIYTITNSIRFMKGVVKV